MRISMDFELLIVTLVLGSELWGKDFLAVNFDQNLVYDGELYALDSD